jgi:prevent-host-death family protein
VFENIEVVAMTETYNIYEAKTHLSALLERVAGGEEIIIAKAGKPRVKLVAIPQAKPKCIPGRLQGKIWVAPDVFSPSDTSKNFPDEEVIVTKFGKPFARFVVNEEGERKIRSGLGEKRGWVSDNFDAPLPAAELRQFYGGAKREPSTPAKHRKNSK